MKIIRLFFLIGFLLTVPILLYCGVYCYFIYEEIILPGINVEGIPLEGLSKEEAVSRVDYQFNQSPKLTVVNVQDLNTVWEIHPAEFGLSVNAIETVERVYEIGRTGSLLDGLDQMLWGIQYGHSIPATVDFNQELAKQALQSWSIRVSAPAQDADFDVRDGELWLFPGIVGKAVDTEATIELVSADPKSTLLEYKLIPILLVDIQPETRGVWQAQEVASTYTASNAEISVYDPILDEVIRWRPTKQEIGNWLDVVLIEGTFEVLLKKGEIESYLVHKDESLGKDRTFDHQIAYQNLVDSLSGHPSEPIQIQYLARVYEVQSWETLSSIGFREGIPYWKLAEANSHLTSLSLRPGETITIPAKDSMLELPVVQNKRIVISIPEQRMWLYQDGEFYQEHVVSTGISRSPTMAGFFQVKSRYENAYASIWDLYMPHFLGIYDATPNLENGIHGLPLLSNGVRLWENVLGRPASYGCIILDLEAAEELYEWAEEGVVVEIIGNS